MTMNNLKNNFMNSKTDTDRIPYNTQHNYCACLFLKENKTYFGGQKRNDVTTKKPLGEK